MDKLLQDLRYGLRMVRQNPGFSVLLVLIVAVGVGSAATIFSIVEKSLLWNENPNVHRWIVVRAFFPRQNLNTNRLSAPEYFDLRGLTDVFERVGAIAGCNLTLYSDNYPELIGGACASADMIPMTASAPMLGRIFTPEDDKPGAPLTVVLTYELWQRRLHGDRAILGQTIRLNDDHYTVIGAILHTVPFKSGEQQPHGPPSLGNSHYQTRSFPRTGECAPEPICADMGARPCRHES